MCFKVIATDEQWESFAGMNHSGYWKDSVQRACERVIHELGMNSIVILQGPSYAWRKRISLEFLALHAVNSKLESVITSYVIGFTEPMRSFNTLNSIDNNQNIAWDKGAYSLITETRSYDLTSNEDPIWKRRHFRVRFPAMWTCLKGLFTWSNCDCEFFIATNGLYWA